jgi:2-octaprenylphenol hydroxylase
VSEDRHTTAFDVVIVGGGMVGTALACALGDSPLSVALIEANTPDYDWPIDSFDLRVSAITRASETFLEQLGVWQTIRNERASAYHNMHVWDAGGNGCIHFDCAEIGAANLGHIVENRVINKALALRAKQFTNVTVFFPTTPCKLQLDNDSATLELDDGTRLKTALLIGADGGQSWVRQQAGISISTRDYQQTAVVANVTTELPHQHTAWQRFLPTGPLAFLPLTNDNISSIVWSTTAEAAARLCQLDKASFNAELEVAFDATLGKIVSSGRRASFPIRGQHATHYVKPHLALVGDAAHTIHPLAGQGVNLGFADARCLAETVLTAHKALRPIGSFKTLRRYERSRRGDNLLMLEAMGVFKRLFSNSTPGLRELRNAGLSLTNRSAPIKHFFMEKALG